MHDHQSTVKSLAVEEAAAGEFYRLLTLLGQQVDIRLMAKSFSIANRAVEV
jgi:hypothetical protein